MPEEPVINAAANLNIAINALARSAPTTANIQTILRRRNDSSAWIIAKKTTTGNVVVSAGFHLFFTFRNSEVGSVRELFLISLSGVFGPPAPLKFASLQETHQFAVLPDNGQRADSVSLH